MLDVMLLSTAHEFTTAFFHNVNRLSNLSFHKFDMSISVVRMQYSCKESITRIIINDLACPLYAHHNPPHWGMQGLLLVSRFIFARTTACCNHAFACAGARFVSRRICSSCAMNLSLVQLSVPQLEIEPIIPSQVHTVWDAHSSSIVGCEYCGKQQLIALWGQSSKVRVYDVSNLEGAPKEVFIMEHSAPGRGL